MKGYKLKYSGLDILMIITSHGEYGTIYTHAGAIFCLHFLSASFSYFV